MIDLSLLKDFTKEKTYQEIENEILNKYKITNIGTDEDDNPLYEICEILCYDYEYKLANYEGYIEVGMNARLLMELRNSVILPYPYGDVNDYYNLFKKCKSPMEVVNIRAKAFEEPIGDLMEEPWQYYFVARFFIKCYGDKFRCDFENCYADGDWSKQLTIEDYRDDFAKCHMEGYNGKTLPKTFVSAYILI